MTAASFAAISKDSLMNRRWCSHPGVTAMLCAVIARQSFGAASLRRHSFDAAKPPQGDPLGFAQHLFIDSTPAQHPASFPSITTAGTLRIPVVGQFKVTHYPNNVLSARLVVSC
jgi:hypothetical protein